MGVLAALAMALVCATAALADEKAEFQAFANCPFHQTSSKGNEVTACTWAESAYKEKWKNKAQKEAWEAEHGPVPNQLSHFTAGNISVNLKLPIVLKLGLAENPEDPENLEVVGASGAPTIEPVPQKGPSLKTTVNTAELSAAELNRYNYYTKVSKQTKTTETIELAGPASALHLNLAHLLNEEGAAFVFPVKVKLGNGFFGDSCYVGTDANPIVVEMTTGPSGTLHGKAGTLTFTPGGTMLTVWGNTLVDSGFTVPGVEGCGVEGGADTAINSALGLPSSSNTAVLNGVLKQAGSEVVEEELGI